VTPTITARKSAIVASVVIATPNAVSYRPARSPSRDRQRRQDEPPAEDCRITPAAEAVEDGPTGDDVEHPDAQDQERGRGRQRHLAEGGQERRRLRIEDRVEEVEPPEEGWHDCQQAQDGHALAPPAEDERGAEQDESDRGLGRHPARVDRADGPGRLAEQQLVDPEVRIQEVLRPDGGTQEEGDEGETVGQPKPTRPWPAGYDDQRPAEGKERDCRVCLHRERAGHDRLQPVDTEDPPAERETAHQAGQGPGYERETMAG
jgi:hypothetical protein